MPLEKRGPMGTYSSSRSMSSSTIMDIGDCDAHSMGQQPRLQHCR